ncbi:MAG: sugar transferase [Chitinophagaceae bacterium]|nr:sugar transferase [Bacteroidota bacterium]MCC6258310.1 sugar transferase [Chitinophagaceae bacterium]
MIRLLDILFSFVGLVLLSPLLLLIALWVKSDSRGPVFFRQIRVGRYGKDFQLFKFRSMRVDADKAGLLTVGGRDPRITGAGYFLRKYKLDELPQLLNVLFGDMSVVGPRPEVRKYVNLYTPEQRQILNVRPGITDMASIEFRNENEILAQSIDPEQTYIQDIMPQKIRLNQVFIKNPTIFNYLRIIFRTVFG